MHHEVKRGATRTVILTKNPSTFSFRIFLQGLLANMQEATFGQLDDNRLCPIKFKLPCGLLIVMPRARVLDQNELSADELEAFCNTGDFPLPTELKHDSFGWLEGNLVAIDYGS